MPKPIKFSYEKKKPFRSSTLLIIVCEGSRREIDYFRFFDGMSSRIRIEPAPCLENKSSPTNLIQVATEAEKKHDFHSDTDQLWFVVDTDRWRKQLHTLRTECNSHKSWFVAQSNPCFEVWLYFHAQNKVPNSFNITVSSAWKEFLNVCIRGGFNSDIHPIAIDYAIKSSKKNYLGNGYFPEPGSTQVWLLGETLIKFIARELKILQGRFPKPFDL